MSTEAKPTLDVVVTRVFDAPVSEVWKSWTDGDRVREWWGPTGFTCPLAEMDFREGGKSLVCMRAPAEFGGMDLYNTWTYTRILPLERFDYIFNFSDSSGRKLIPSEIGMPAGIPEDGHHVVTFRSLPGGKTEMTVAEHGYTSTDATSLSKPGLEQCLDKMAISLRSRAKTR